MTTPNADPAPAPAAEPVAAPVAPAPAPAPAAPVAPDPAPAPAAEPSTSLLAAEAAPPGAPPAGEGTADEEFQLPEWSKVVAALAKKDKALGERAKRYGSFEDMARNDLNLRKEIGKAREGYVKPPGEGASEEDVKAWRKALGVPESAAAYGIAPKDDAPPEAAEELGAFLDLAHRNNLPADAVKMLVEFDRIRAEAADKRRRDADVRAVDEAEGQLQAKLMGDYRRTRELANRSFDHFGGDAGRALMEKEVDGRKLGAHPLFVEVFGKIGEMLQEDIPHLAATRDTIAGEWQQMQAEHAKVAFTPAHNADFQRRYEEVFRRAQGAGLA